MVAEGHPRPPGRVAPSPRRRWPRSATASRARPCPAGTLDADNAGFHGERADWSWDRVLADADAALEALVAEIAAATDEMIADQKVLGTIMGDGPEHDMAHLAAVARAASGSRCRASRTRRADRRWSTGGCGPTRRRVARYNLACFRRWPAISTRPGAASPGTPRQGGAQGVRPGETTASSPSANEIAALAEQ